jgi:hypothetical protein
MSNYDLDEIERKKSQKQNKQWRDYVDSSLKHPLANEGFGRDDQDNIKNILRPSKPCQQWDAQTQSYVEVIKELDKDVKEMRDDPVGYELYNAPENILPLGNKEIVEKSNEDLIKKPNHYEGFGISPLEYITVNELDFIEGNIIKYVSRYQSKGGVNDLLKAQTYLEKLIERERGKNE